MTKNNLKNKVFENFLENFKNAKNAKKDNIFEKKTFFQKCKKTFRNDNIMFSGRKT